MTAPPHLLDRPGHDAVLTALAAARRAGGPVAVAQALTLAHRRLRRPGLEGLRRRLAGELIAESARTRRHRDTLVGLLFRAVDLLLDGDLRATRCLTEVRCLLEIDDDPEVGFLVRAIDVMIEIRAGRLDDAERRAERCAEAGMAAGHRWAARWHASQLIAIRWYQGRIAEVLPTIREVVASAGPNPADHSYHSALAAAAAAAGDRATALGALAALRDRGLSRIPLSGSWLATMYGAVEAAHHLGAADVAAEAYELLSPYAGMPVTAGPGIACFGSVEHALGLAKLTCGQVDAAVEHLRTSVRENLALGHWPAATLARHRLAHAMDATGRREHRALAQQEARTARHDALDLGMRLPHRPDPARRSPAAPAGNRQHQPKRWRISAAGRVATVEHCRGMTCLAVLIANPGHEIAPIELAAGPGRRPPSAPGTADDRTIRRHRDRIEQVQRRIERYDRIGDRDAAIEAHRERDALLGRLRTATGLAEGARTTSLDEERARIAVGKAIRRALARITGADRELGDTLAARVHTGHRCIYLPGDETSRTRIDLVE